MALTTDRIIQNLQAISGYDGVIDAYSLVLGEWASLDPEGRRVPP